MCGISSSRASLVLLLTASLRLSVAYKTQVVYDVNMDGKQVDPTGIHRGVDPLDPPEPLAFPRQPYEHAEFEKDGLHYSAVNGVYPKDCVWRVVRNKETDEKFYEYWDFNDSSWGRDKPSGCFAKQLSQEELSSYDFRGRSPRSEVQCTDSYCIYTNLWAHGGRWYVLVDGPKHVDGWKMSRNQEVNSIHVKDARAFTKSVNFTVVPGDTLVFDYIFFIHPTAIGHWGEMMYPLFSILRRTDFRRPADTFVLLHLKRQHLMEWARTVMSVALGVGPQEGLPPIVLQTETDDLFKQVVSPLEGFPNNQWVVFERALVVRDVFTGGQRSFHSHEDAQLFRQLLYQQFGLPPPTPWVPPRKITFQRKSANRRVLNEEGLLDLLREFGELQVVEFSSGTPFVEQLDVIRQTGVYVSVHTSNLANTPFLRPGSCVVELIQRYWVWNNIDQSFKDQTKMMGDIHHFAWRAIQPHESTYLNERDAIRFGNWTIDECWTEECVEAQTNVDITVDLDALRAILEKQLPLVYQGVPVKDADIPWPASGASGPVQ